MPKKYQKVASHEAKKGEFKRCLLLYSGGLDTSVMLKWIQEKYEVEVIALTIDIGQVADNLNEIKAKALNLGAKDAIVYDAKTRFADEIISQAIKANADYQGGYALSTPLGRVIISEVAIEVAKEYDCQVIAHGCTGKGNDQVRFESYLTTLDDKIKTIAPVREWGMGREEELEYAEKHNIPVKQQKSKPYSYDENMWGNTAEGGEIEDSTLIAPNEDILQWCKTPENALDEKQNITLTFEEGLPVKLNDQLLPLAELILKCNEIGGFHGAGVFNLIEDRLIGLKVRGIYENPGASIIISAHKKLEQLVSTREENELKTFIDTKWAYLNYAAQWYNPVMNNIHSFINEQNKKVTGVVTVSLYKGNLEIVAVESPFSLLKAELATFDAGGDLFNHNASAGFIELHSLSQRTAYSIMKNKK
ncbi:argininosuccinate synthase [Francisella adeliensis]|uniref:Argininosuccinate synthase n=1 Tax=Francisella adeliensis TaxID=2007306 RepID=A0A2Z4Y0I8_9GAMM|nr:argininosuccinate synthase [Francisella adeliensis]AXA34499.1 argininosuccinate synthase [Francisella adeliensis]MBK2086219.1 argininosuccinate synthase [Francisella adeliensis]MBK2096436.1 argininosuccinate synthase [Francisella adeliensis]QIW12746.1 argininosuccinate synthase [Francisella adeliensis]QIW14623.1 argininosuccinate synthase [Francisella adeliensis]